jgi:DUF1365 family protein
MTSLTDDDNGTYMIRRVHQRQARLDLLVHARVIALVFAPLALGFAFEGVVLVAGGCVLHNCGTGGNNTCMS